MIHLNEERNCYDCVKCRLCYVFRDVDRDLKDMPKPEEAKNFVAEKLKVFAALANICVEFQARKS